MLQLMIDCLNLAINFPSQETVHFRIHFVEERKMLRMPRLHALYWLQCENVVPQVAEKDTDLIYILFPTINQLHEWTCYCFDKSLLFLCRFDINSTRTLWWTKMIRREHSDLLKSLAGSNECDSERHHLLIILGANWTSNITQYGVKFLVAMRKLSGFGFPYVLYSTGHIQGGKYSRLWEGMRIYSSSGQ